ncbi:hypothetical protein AVEN_75805-1, partial [Araneus ventricosus]
CKTITTPRPIFVPRAEIAPDQFGMDVNGNEGTWGGTLKRKKKLLEKGEEIFKNYWE